MTISTLALALSLALAGESAAPAKSAPVAPPAAASAPSNAAAETSPPAQAAGPEKAASETPAAAAPVTEREPGQPPPGSKEDQALWQAAHDVNTQLVNEQHASGRLRQGLKRSELPRKLQDLAKSGAIPQARADELSARLQQKWAANLDIVRRPWPVGKLRVCGYELLNFEALVDPPTQNKVQMEEAREELTECVGRANKVLRPLRKSNQELQAVVTEIDREVSPLLPKPAAVPPPKPATAVAAPPSPEAAAVAEAGRRGAAHAAAAATASVTQTAPKDEPAPAKKDEPANPK